uniref:Uncharacterized protein n=1 Tax=Anguilla anguilla TaxID=7936 RepID=A0A0E9RGJ2_ANGAN
MVCDCKGCLPDVECRCFMGLWNDTAQRRSWGLEEGASAQVRDWGK